MPFITGGCYEYYAALGYSFHAIGDLRPRAYFRDGPDATLKLLNKHMYATCPAVLPLKIQEGRMGRLYETLHEVGTRNRTSYLPSPKVMPTEITVKSLITRVVDFDLNSICRGSFLRRAPGIREAVVETKF